MSKLYGIDSTLCRCSLKSWRRGISKNKLGCELRLKNVLSSGYSSKVEKKNASNRSRREKNIWDTLKNSPFREWRNKFGKKKNVGPSMIV